MRDSLLRITVAACLIAMATGATAQEALTEAIEVRVADVDVVVTDAAGRPVRGLTRDDFELFENGRQVPLSNFREVVPEELAATSSFDGVSSPPQASERAADPARSRHFVLLVDSYSLHPFQRNRVFDSMAQFLRREFRDGDTASLAEWSPAGLHVIVPATSDRAALIAGMAAIRKHASVATNDADQAEIRRYCSTRGVAADDCFWRIHSYEDHLIALMDDLLDSIRTISSSLAGLDGRKVVVLAGAYLPDRPGLELQLFASKRFQGDGSRAYVNTVPRTRSLDDLARDVNARGVTLYAINTADRDDVIGANKADPVDPEEAFTRKSNTDLTFARLAGETGGVAIHQTDFDRAFQTIASDLASWYSLGYRPDGNVTGERSVEVRTRDRSLRVRARNSITLRTTDEETADRVVANLFATGAGGGMPVEVRVGAAEKRGRIRRVPIDVTFPSSLALLPLDGDLRGGFTVYIAVGMDGRSSPVVRRLNPIRIAAAQEGAFRARPLLFHADLEVRPGESLLSVGILDQVSNASGFARATIVAR